jgi:uncharacterized protein (TIGR02118 family)
MSENTPAKNLAVIVYVTYQGTPETRFDRTYYVDHHLPLVMESWHQYGLESVAAYFPAIDQDGTIAICECRFESEKAKNLAFLSAETSAVMADVARYTDVEPNRVRAIAL